MRLHISMLGSEKPLCALDRFSLDSIDVIAACIEPMIRKSLGILIGKQVSHCSLH